MFVLKRTNFLTVSVSQVSPCIMCNMKQAAIAYQIWELNWACVEHQIACMSLRTHPWLQTVHLMVPSALASQCLWDYISTSLGLHLNVFGTASQCLWDCISMTLGMHLNDFGTASQWLRECISKSLAVQVSAERFAALNPRLYNFQVDTRDLNVFGSAGVCWTLGCVEPSAVQFPSGQLWLHRWGASLGSAPR